MSVERIKALLLEEYFITIRSLEVILDLFFLSVMSVIVFGFFSLFLSSRVSGPPAHYLLLGMLLWEVVRVTQYSISLGAMWEVWSRNLTNLFITPLRLHEYLIAAMISGAVKSVLILATVSLISGVLFEFDITSIGLANLALAFLNLSVFAFAVGLAILGVIFRYGTRIQALAWGVIFLFQPLTAVYFPVDVLPQVLQRIADIFPPTYVFEMARQNLSDQSIDWGLVLKPLALNVVYISCALWFFNLMYTGSRRSGQFAKLGT
jgi:ABC-2 type transport system permease protein